MSSHPSWNPDDDYLLKVGVEKGYPFLAMAKGAVRFSRKYTVNEMRERWRMLLYDPVVSAQLAEWMVKREAGNGSVKGGGGSGNKFVAGSKVEDGEGPGKRKVESVLKLYYGMRKKFREENFIGGGDFVVGDCMEECCMVGDGVGEEFGFREDGVSDFCYGDMSGFEDDRNGVVRSDSMDVISEKNLSFPVKQLVKLESDQSFEHNFAHKDVPLWKTMEDVTPPAMPVDVSLGDRREGPAETLVYPGDIDGDVDLPGPMLVVEGCNGGEIGSSAVIHGSDLMYLPDSLLNFNNEEEVPFIVEGGKDIMDETCHFLSSPMDVCEDPKRNDSESKAPIPHPQSAAPGESCFPETAVVSDQSIPLQCNATISLEVCVPSSASICDPCSSEVHDEIVECVLNTEDPEIPCNDDFSPCKPYVPFALRPAHKESGNPSSSSGYEKDIDYTSSQGCPAKSTTAWRKGPNMLADTKPDNPRVDCGVKSEFVYGNSLDNLFTQAIAVPAERPSCTSNLETPVPSTGEIQREEFSNAFNARHVTLHSESGLVNVCPELEVDPTMSDAEDSLNDDDIPCFYDIEAMILDMDLCPENEYPDISQQVARYEDESTRRRIMRLEQCVQSSTRRAIASQGAFGVFYGRQLKYYLKKTEVIIGRATEGHDVDIDLNREGRANKVSRRQALIRMEGDGSFILKNLGRHEIYLNGDEITQGQAISLASGSLIEVKEMAFIFEVNHKFVRNYLAKIARKSQESNGQFEWTPEDAL